MALTPRLELRHSQSLVMTPQLQQAIKLLQLNNLELSAYVEQELEENPLLERAEPEPEGERHEGEPDMEDGGKSSEDSLASVDLENETASAQESEEARDVDYDNEWAGDGPGQAASEQGDSSLSDWSNVGAGGGAGGDSPERSLEQTLSGALSLRDHLQEQIGVELDDPVERVIAVHLMELLDEAGYLSGDLETVAQALDCDMERVEATLERVQGFTPTGIFARNLQECLALQLREKDRLDPAMQTFLDNLDLLAKHDLKGLSRRCGVDAEDIADMIDEIRALNPKPALSFDFAVIQPVTPDVLMRPNPDGGWLIELNSETLPKVLVNNQYYSSISGSARNKADKQYIAECYQSANWLVKSLHQRATTILKVATEIVTQQSEFFVKGVRFLKPLILRDIAEEIEMHESTVSRVTSNKYIATPRGIFELKYFFTTALGNSAGGEAHSAEAVRHRIKVLIDEEPVKKILSDDRIAEILQNEGIDIARRTVAKYREAMRIPSSVQRRREKKAALR